MATPRLIIPGLYELTLPMPLTSVNVFFLLTAEGVTLIDTGYPDHGAGVLAGLTALGRTPAEVKHIIVTHHHVDHAGNLAVLQRYTQAQIWMHPADADLVAQGQCLRPTLHGSPGLFNRLAFSLARMLLPRTIQPARVDHLIADNEVIPVAGGLQVIHIPGHSTGQIGLYWRVQKTLFVADAVMHRDKSLQLPLVIEDLNTEINSISRLARYDCTTICFGHGLAITNAAGSALQAYAAAVVKQ
mgnify:FL=1